MSPLWKATAQLLVLCFLLALGSLLMPQEVQAAPVELPKISIEMGQEGEPGRVVGTLKILFLLTILVLAPTIMITMTPFTRIVIVFFFLRQAMGTQQTPPNPVLIGLALFLTFFIMQPVLADLNENVMQPYMNEEISQEEAFERAALPMKTFMLKQTREKDLALFLEISGSQRPNSMADVSFYLVVPAYIISELKTAFQIGFLIYLPFLILDMVIASVLMAMGMMMLPPVIISLPFKIMLFVLVDGWNLLVGQLVKSFH